MSSESNIKIVLILMIKNESKIIERCLTNVLPIVDAVCICDTGSTDDTLSIAKNFLSDKNIKYRIFEYPFTDFGESRSKSFQNTLTFINEDLKWDLNTTFGFLVDADMVLVYGEDFRKSFFTNEYDSYKLLQVQGENEYYNVRLILMSREWKCVGKTHEVWVNTTTFGKNGNITGKNFLWFDDISDGGCKDDKFERDERLLLQGLEEEPNLYTRYCFYLGQTYWGLKNYEKAIEYYKKRSDVRDEFHEEIWFSLFMVSYSYAHLEDIKNFEKYALEAFEFYPCRAEPMLLLAGIFKEQKDYVKAWKYLNIGMKVKMPEHQLLYFKDKIYLYDFYYQKSHLLFLTNPENLEDIRDCFCHMLNYKYIKKEELIELLSALRTVTIPLSQKSEVINETHFYEKDFYEKDFNDNQININLENVRLPHFISSYFIPNTLKNFSIKGQTFLNFYNPNTFANIFLIFNENRDFVSFIPPFCIENSKNNEFILTIRKSSDEKDLLIYYTLVGNNEYRLAKIDIESILSKKMSILPFLN